MQKYLAIVLLAGALLASVLATIASAQEPDPADQVKAFLTGKGYTVSDVAHVADEQGQPRPAAIYVLMDAVAANLDHPDLATQVLWGFAALYQYYPRATDLQTVLGYQSYWIFFTSTRSDVARYADQSVTAAAFWSGVRSRVRIYDRVKKVFTDEKTYTGTIQAGKDQTGKDFGGSPKNPVPTPVPAGTARAGVLWVEPSTTYLPVDGQTQGVLMATLLDERFLPVGRRLITFSAQAPGADEQVIGYKTTDANGRALAGFRGSTGQSSLLLRSVTGDINSQVSILLGPVLGRKTDQVKAVTKGLQAQGYTGVEVEYWTQTRATGDVDNIAYVQMRMVSNTFDRAVYGQISRGLGTLRTVFPQVTRLLVALIYRKDGHDWQLLWEAQVAHWDQLVAGKIGENDFWRNLQYAGTFDEDGHPVTDKDFVNKNFGAGTPQREARVTRTLESTLFQETWGEQWHGQEFVILPGSYADAFAVAEWSGSAVAIQIYQSPDFATPFLNYTRDGNPADLATLRLGQGQYLFAVVAPAAPAAVSVTYTEHLPQ